MVVLWLPNAGVGGCHYCHPGHRLFIVKNRLKSFGMGKKQEKYKNTATSIRSPLQWISCIVICVLTKIYKYNMPYCKDTTCNNCQLIAINYGPDFPFINTFEHHWIIYFSKDFYLRLYSCFYTSLLNTDLALMCLCFCRSKPLNLSCSFYHVRLWCFLCVWSRNFQELHIWDREFKLVSCKIGYLDQGQSSYHFA